jgi:hypothetical protein
MAGKSIMTYVRKLKLKDKFVDTEQFLQWQDQPHQIQDSLSSSRVDSNTYIPASSSRISFTKYRIASSATGPAPLDTEQLLLQQVEAHQIRNISSLATGSSQNSFSIVRISSTRYCTGKSHQLHQ